MKSRENGKNVYDGVIVGSGPNGLAAAITLARRGLRVLVLEGKDTIGGGSRSAALTMPGFTHDVCSAVHPLALSSPFFKSLDLAAHGVEWVFPQYSLAHPLDGGRAVLVNPSLALTAASLGGDAKAYFRLLQPLVDRYPQLMAYLLSPLRLPRSPFQIAAFGLQALRSANGLARSVFKTEEARAVFAGMAAHGMIPLDRMGTASFGLVLALGAHAVGWPVVKGGSQRIVDAMVAILRELGGEIVTGRMISKLEQLPPSRVLLLDVSPRDLLTITGEALPPAYRERIARYRYGPGVFKVDWALSAPIPWVNPSVAGAATVHLGGTLEEITASEHEVAAGRHPQSPYVLLVQPSLFDPSRAPAGKHTAWAYCHVPNGSTVDMREIIENQVERFAPGFRQTILAASTINAAAYEVYNPNYVGGDINTGAQDLGQLFTRPVPRWDPYATPLDGVYLCSSATPPGGGVHGMCGFLAAKSALTREFHLSL